jgi:4a-hydroxytetrahydrobiopterin dehydratase
MLTGWREDHNSLRADFTFPDFDSTMRCINLIADAARSLDHHPEWTNVYNCLSVKLTTHDAGNAVTEKDKDLAADINVAVAACGGKIQL